MKIEKQVCLTLPESLYKQIKQAAGEDFMTVNALIRVAVARYLRERPCDSNMQNESADLKNESFNLIGGKF